MWNVLGNFFVPGVKMCTGMDGKISVCWVSYVILYLLYDTNGPPLVNCSSGAIVTLVIFGIFWDFYPGVFVIPTLDSLKQEDQDFEARLNHLKAKLSHIPKKKKKDKRKSSFYLVLGLTKKCLFPMNHNDDQHGTVSLKWLSFMVVINSSLFGLRVHLTGGKSCLVLETQLTP